jgi:hypothetical protein
MEDNGGKCLYLGSDSLLDISIRCKWLASQVLLYGVKGEGNNWGQDQDCRVGGQKLPVIAP